MKYLGSCFAVFAFALALFGALRADEPPITLKQPGQSKVGYNDAKIRKRVELGTVRWHRDFDKAVELSKQQGKPLAILFQEVPGCAGCQKYGQQVLSHPHIVESLEDNFIPVAVFNNAGGRDRQILTQFKEPAWNYQVMRFTDENLRELIPRKDQVWTVFATAHRLTAALKAAKHDPPSYLTDVVAAESNPQLQTAVFAMYCFWTGEAKLGAIDGVTATEAGFYDNREVVVVRYDPKTVSLVSLTRRAASIDCAHAVYLPDEKSILEIKGATRLAKLGRLDPKKYRRAPASDQKRQLQSTTGLAKLGLTPMQLTKLNSRGVSKDSISRWLTPRQMKLLK